MNILVPDEWLREFLKTNATSRQIAESLSLCGPSVEKVENSVYSIEVTTNRVDSASVLGIAKEASAILPRFGFKALFSESKLRPLKFKKRVNYLSVKIDSNLCPRFTAVLIRNVHLSDSPEWLKKRLAAVGVRPINNVVDISNYIMHEIGQPVHTFDYQKITRSTMILRPSRKGEKITTLDEKTHLLKGNDIVIEDGSGRLIDLAGIMGGANSAVDANSKDILLFVQTYNPLNIRRTSMSLAQRSEAAELFEKGLDTELVTRGISRGIELFSQLTHGKADAHILDIYPHPYEPKTIQISLDFIESRMGTALDKKEISKLLATLGFDSKWDNHTLTTIIPSFRSGDVSQPVDIVEEIARIYGYFRLPSRLMTGAIPEPIVDSPFDFEAKIKNILKGYGGIEVYTLSMIEKNTGHPGQALKLANPLGKDSEYLRTSLAPSLIKAAEGNSGEKEPFHLFELANIYLPDGHNLPQEKMTLAGIMVNSSFLKVRGTVEALLSELNFSGKLVPEEGANFRPGRRLSIKTASKEIGELGELENGYFYYEISTQDLQSSAREVGSYSPLPKYPAQIEDITLSFPDKTKIGEVLETLKSVNKLLAEVQLVNTYKNNFTFRLWYQDSTKTLTNEEVSTIHKNILAKVKRLFGAIPK